MSYENDGDKKLEFASSARIERYEHLLPKFFAVVLVMDYEDIMFVSDESSLWDFTTALQGPKSHEAEVGLFMSRIEETYRIDVSDIEDVKLIKILERVSAESR